MLSGTRLANAQGKITFAEQAPYKKGAISLSVTIQVKSPVTRGKDIPIHIELVNNGENTFLYNVHFNRLISSPAGIILFDKHKHFVADLFDFDNFPGSHGAVTPNDWSTIKKNEVVKIDDTFTMFTFAHWTPENPLSMSTGRYYIQLIYWRRFIPRTSYSKPSDWKLTQPLFRSNPIQIDVK